MADNDWSVDESAEEQPRNSWNISEPIPGQSQFQGTSADTTPPPAQPPMKTSAIGAFGTGFAQGVTHQFGDEIIGAGSVLAPKKYTLTDDGNVAPASSVPDTYKKARDATREGLSVYEAEHPIASFGGNMVGTILSEIALMRGGGKIRGSAVGAGGALADYLGEKENISDAELLPALGWTAAGGVPVEAAQQGINYIRRNFGAKSNDQVADVIAQLVEDSGMTPDEVLSEARKLGIDEASLIDSTGDAGVAYGQGLSGTSGNAVRQKLKEHFKKIGYSKKRVRESMDEATGVGEGQYYESLDKLKKNRKSRAEENYGQALDDTRFDVTPEMSQIMANNPTVKQAWEQVQQKYKQRGVELPNWYKLDENGVPQIPDVGHSLPARVMQDFKFELDQLVRDSSTGIDSASKTQNRLITRDRGEMMESMYTQNPDFRKANAAYAGDIAMEEAQAMGKKHGLGGADIDSQLEYVKTLSKTEKEAYLQGIMSNTYGKLGSSPEEVLGNVNRMVSDNSVQLLTALVGESSARKILKQVSSEKRFRNVGQQVGSGSQTQLRKSAIENFKEIGDTSLKGLGLDMYQKAPVKKIAERVGNEVVGRTPLTPQMRLELVDLMAKPGGVAEALARLEKAGVPKQEASWILAGLRSTLSEGSRTITEATGLLD